MSRQQKTPIPVAKKVLPPAVPQEYRHSGSSFGSSTGYASSDDAVFLLTPDIPQKGTFFQQFQLRKSVSALVLP